LTTSNEIEKESENMENPFLHIKRMNTKLKVIIATLVVLIPVTFYTAKVSADEYYKRVQVENAKLVEEKQKHDSKVKLLRDEIEKQKVELKKFTLTKNIIKDFIKDRNPKINEVVANRYAVTIVRESRKRGNSPYVQAALLASESSFNSNARHSIRTVIGMGGIYYDVWGKKLKQEGIAYNIGSLKNPYVNIEASSYVLATYMDMSKSPREALSRYKGYCSLGISQANNVMSVALKLKAKERALIA
jgi:hypothetical protein